MKEIFSNKVINDWAILINILGYESCYLRYLGNTPNSGTKKIKHNTEFIIQEAASYP
jgi:hypothetical protein